MIDEKTNLSGNRILASYMDSEHYMFDQTTIEWFQIMTVWFRLINDTRFSHKSQLQFVGSSILTGEIDKAWSSITAFVHKHSRAKCIKSSTWAQLDGEGPIGPFTYETDDIYDFTVDKSEYWGDTYQVISADGRSVGFGTNKQAARNFFEYFKLVS